MSSSPGVNKGSVVDGGKENAVKLMKSSAMSVKTILESSDSGLDLDTPLLQRLENMLQTKELNQPETYPEPSLDKMVWPSPIESPDEFVSLRPKHKNSRKTPSTSAFTASFFSSNHVMQTPVDTIEPAMPEMDSSNHVERSSMDDCGAVSSKGNITGRRRSRKPRKDKIGLSPIELDQSVSPITDMMESTQTGVTLDTTLPKVAMETNHITTSGCHVAARKRPKQRRNNQSDSLTQPEGITISPNLATENNNCDKSQTDSLFNSLPASLNDVHSASMLSAIPQELIDSIHLPFDDEPTQPKRKAKASRRKSRRSMDFAIQLPPPELQPSPDAECLINAASLQPSKVNRSRRRRTADFEVMASVLSPPTPDLEEVPFSLPAPRRSRRLKRQSMELYRSSIISQEAETTIDLTQSESPVVSSTTPVSAANSQRLTGADVSTTAAVPMATGVTMATGDQLSMDTDFPLKTGGSPNTMVASSASDSQVWPSTSAEDQSSMDTAMIMDTTLPETSVLSESAILDDAMLNMCIDSEQTLSESLLEDSLLDTSQEEPRRPRRKAAANNSYTPEKKNPKGTKRKREVSVEDVYLNKLWKSEMDKFPTLETIHEEPHKNKQGQEDYFSNRKCRRFVNYDDFNSQPRLKKRRKKAMKSGWKPLTKKQHEKADRLILEKISVLDDDIRKITYLLDQPVEQTCDLLDNNDPQSDLLDSNDPQSDLLVDNDPQSDLLVDNDPQSDLLVNNDPQCDLLDNNDPQSDLLVNNDPQCDLLVNNDPKCDLLVNADAQCDAEEMFYTPGKVLACTSGESHASRDDRHGGRKADANGCHGNEEMARPLATMEEEEEEEDFMTPMKDVCVLETSDISGMSLSPAY